MPELSKVVALSPEDFQAWWAGSWEQGEHVTLIAATGSGKTTLGAYLCSVRKWALALDAKGMDSTLAATGWQRVTKWPLPRSMRAQVRDGQVVRVVVGKRVKSDKEFDANAAMMRRVLADAWAQGRWTVWADEGQLLADRRFGDAGDRLEKMLIAARDRGISLVYAVQRPQIGRSTPSANAAFSQATWLFIARTRDDRVADRVAEIAGRPAAEMRGLIAGLPRYWWACLSLDPHEPVRLVKPPKLGGKPPPGRQRQQSQLSVWLWGAAA